MLAPILTTIILLGYAAALWWLLRRESVEVLLVLAALTVVSLALRLLYTTDFPDGLYEDEPNILLSATAALRGGKLFGESSVVIPVLLAALFQGQLVPILGPTRWAIRAYSIGTSVLSTPAMFGLARAFGLRVVPSLAGGALIAVLPWALLYGRIHLGGELVFHELLLLAALVRLVWCNGRWIEVMLGGFAQCLLLYDYWCGRAMLGMPLVAAVLARGWRRVLCLLIVVLALIGYIPYLAQRPHYALRGLTEHIRPETVDHPLRDVADRTVATLNTFLYPTAGDGWATIRAGALHPALILALAMLGVVLNPGRRGLFLLAGFLGGLVPAALSDGAPSTHRMMMAFAFIPLAAACALDTVRWRVLRTVMTVTVVLIVSVQSLRLYFSDDYWLQQARWLFDSEKTSLVESLPEAPHAHFIVARQLGYYFHPRTLIDSDYEILGVGNWYPPSGRAVTYLYEQHQAPLRGFYDALLGPERVKTFGRCFSVDFPAGDWSWLRQHGWTYEAHCGPRVWRAQVPALLQTGLSFSTLHCGSSVTHVWRGRWTGPATTLRLKWSGAGTVYTPNGRVVQKAGFEQMAEFTVEPDWIVTVNVTLDLGWSMFTELFEVTPTGERLPPWDHISPYIPEWAGAATEPLDAAVEQQF